MTADGVEPAATLTRSGASGIITLNRPRAMNAVNADLSAAVGAALEEVEADDTLAVAVVTGSGRAFCAGADLKAIAAGQSITAPGHDEWGFAGLVEHPISKPVIAAVNGFALGGGTEIVLSCDLAVLSADATLGLPEVTRGLFAAAGGLIQLPRHLPYKIAMEIALTGSPLAADEALARGLVNRVVPNDDVLPTALALAEEIARNAPLSVRTSKALIRGAAGIGSPWDTNVWELQAKEWQQIVSTKDAHEGATAFAEKREPKWSGT